MTTFEQLGIRGVNPNGADKQYVQCPKCRPHQRTPTDCLTVWVKDGTFSCNKCFWGKGIKVGSTNIREWRQATPKAPLTTPSDKMYEWFAKRGIPRGVVDRNRITRSVHWFPQVKEERPATCFAYYVGDTLTNIKYRDREKNFSQLPGADQTFYKINDIAESSTAIICEGEIDALSFEVAGMTNAISVPGGAPNPEARNVDQKLAFLEDSRFLLSHIDKFYIATDNDGPGIRLREELSRRLGRSKCWVVRFPDGCKDANDVLVRHGAERLALCIDQAELYPVEGAVDAASRFENLDDLHEYGFPDGARTGWEQFDEHFMHYPGQLTIVTGIPGHGKSNFLDDLSHRLAALYGWKWGLFSPEHNPIEIHELRLAEIFVGKPFLPSYNGQMSREDLQVAKEFIRGHYHYILPENEEYTIDNILTVAEYYVQAKGIRGLILDPWNTIEHQAGPDQSETLYTAKILNKIKSFARAQGIHIFLVAHPTKMETIGRKKDSEVTNYQIPNLYNISGSAHWFNIADNGMTVYRHYFEDGTSQTHVYIQKVKHRFIGKTGKVMFNFDRSCSRFSPAAFTLTDPLSGMEIAF